ncbi:MAG: CDP-alcohol phosphatidyltransferase family protein [Pseudomonadota bacterium]
MAYSQLPPFSTLLKSRDVEDPVNLWLHRPLAYGLVTLIHRTPVTPNQITLLSMFVGLTAAILWVLGSSTQILVGGILLWTSAILDGADGILARAKNAHSELGRALDGAADMVVALSTVAASFYHIWVKHHDPEHIPAMGIALVTAVVQIQLYDYYKELYQNCMSPDRHGKITTAADIEIRLEKAQANRAPFFIRFSWASYAGMLKSQEHIRRLTNPRATHENFAFNTTEQTASIYRKHNYWPMQLWTLISLCPHTYMLSICAIFNRIDIYLWYRVIGGNAIFLAAIIWQRVATNRTLRDFKIIDNRPAQTTT